MAVGKVFYKSFRKNKWEYNISKLKHREQCKSCRGAVMLPRQSLRQPPLGSLLGEVGLCPASANSGFERVPSHHGHKR